MLVNLKYHFDNTISFCLFRHNNRGDIDVVADRIKVLEEQKDFTNHALIKQESTIYAFFVDKFIIFSIMDVSGFFRK